MSGTTVEKHCERCGQILVKGEGYAETDIGSGKWVHWPNCPKKEEKPRGIEHTPVGSDLVHDRLVAEGWNPLGKIPRVDEALKAPGKGGSSSPELALEMVKRQFTPEHYEFKIVKHYALHPQFPYIAFVKELPLASPETIKCGICGAEVTGIIGHDRCPYCRHILSTAPMPPEKSEKTATPEDVEADVDVLIDNLVAAIKAGGDIPPYLRDALRKSFMALKGNPGNPHPPGNPGTFTVRFNEGTDKQEDVTLEAPSTAAATILAARKYYEKHGAYPTTAKLKK